MKYDKTSDIKTIEQSYKEPVVIYEEVIYNNYIPQSSSLLERNSVVTAITSSTTDEIIRNKTIAYAGATISYSSSISANTATVS
ncbi:MAG: hypothetical protein U9Q80_08145 [Bacillota bacterium]|nr:hypothetical protein [Bacillota bacterium]